MGRKATYTPELAKQIQDMHRRGLSREAIAQQLKASGSYVPPARTITRIASDPKSPAGRSKAKPRALPQKDRPVEPDHMETMANALRGAVETINRVAGRVDMDRADSEDLRMLNQSYRTLSVISAQLARLTPPTPVDPNDRPDMQAAAEQCKAALLEYADRAIAKK